MNKLIETKVGKIAITESGSGETCLLFIHGNSSSKSVFSKQLSSDLAKKYRLIALDLPGHGDSDNALNPQQ
ncbi:MAG: alpha/beta hydrolase, partial [Gammaproteobacteria bacterium]